MGIIDCNSEETLQKIALIRDEVEQKVNELLKNEKRQLGFGHIYSYTKKKILKEDYGIDWLTPSECNPFVIFD